MNSRLRRLTEAAFDPKKPFGGLIRLWLSRDNNIRLIKDVGKNLDGMIREVQKGSDHTAFVLSLHDAVQGLAKVCEWVVFPVGERILKEAAASIRATGVPIAKAATQHMKDTGKETW